MYVQSEQKNISKRTTWDSWAYHTAQDRRKVPPESFFICGQFITLENFPLWGTFFFWYQETKSQKKTPKMERLSASGKICWQANTTSACRQKRCIQNHGELQAYWETCRIQSKMICAEKMKTLTWSHYDGTQNARLPWAIPQPHFGNV